MAEDKGLFQQMDENSAKFDASSPLGYLRLLAEQGYAANEKLQKTIADALPERTGEIINERFPLMGLTAGPRGAIESQVKEGVDTLDEMSGGWVKPVLGSAELAATLYNPSTVAGKKVMHKTAANLPNDMPGFYLNVSEATKRAQSRMGGYLYEKSPSSAIKFEQGLAKVNAIGKGVAKGLGNALSQSFTPQGRALWEQKGISKTLEDIAKDPKGIVKEDKVWGVTEKARQKEAVWGQPAYERMLGSQYGKKSPILTQLDNDYFTHEGVFSYDDFKKFSGHDSDVDSQAFFRTIAANNGIKQNDQYVMLLRQPTGTEDSGTILSDVLYRNATVSKIDKAFNPQAGFNSGESFLRFYDKGKRSAKTEMSEEQRAVIRKAYRDTPELKGITDRGELITTLTKAVAKAAKARGVKPFSVAQYTKAALKRREAGAFKSNDDLAEALKSQGLNPIRNSKQETDPDVFLVGTTHSSAYELGGVNLVYKVEKDGTIKGQLSDVNDLVGVGAPMGMPLITVTPVMTRKVGQKAPTDRNTSHSRSDVYQDVLEPYSPSKGDYAQAGARQASAATPLVGAAEAYQDDNVKGMLLQ